MLQRNTIHNTMDMTSGALLPKILRFSIPLMLSGMLQLLFNAADIVVVGQFSDSGPLAIAAVGSTTSIINLLVSLFVGMSVGVNVLVARYFAAGQKKDLQETVHTAIALSLLCGTLLAAIGIILCRRILILMSSPEEVLGLSTLYLRIYFAGMPLNFLYNFGNAIHQAIGDTQRPLYYLTAAGIVNVVLNMIFVIAFRMDVGGVALATVLSQAVSAFLIVRNLMNAEGDFRLELKKVRLYGDKVRRILEFGIPAGLQGVVFNLSNVLIQSSINSFGSVAMAGNAAAQNLEGFVYMAMNAIAQTCISFTGQNYGARKYERLGKVLKMCLAVVTVTGLVLGAGVYLLGTPLLSIYSSDPETIRYGLVRLQITCLPYCICGWMDTSCGGVRGLGHSVIPMIVSLLGSCVFRVVWVFTVFAAYRTLQILYVSYPISWAVTAAVHLICFNYFRKKLLKSV